MELGDLAGMVSSSFVLSLVGEQGIPHPRVFLWKSLELLENKGVACCRDDKEFVTVWG